VLKKREIRQFGEYRTRRRGLEAWDRLEGVEIGNSEGYLKQVASHEPMKETIQIRQPKPESRLAVAPARTYAPAKKEGEFHVVQLTLTDFGLYKCESCGKMMMGFEKENHEREKHIGKNVEWRKMR
jgi:hypothetical protein